MNYNFIKILKLTLACFAVVHCQSEGGNECPPNECDLVCVNGFKTDDNGCEICDCIPCPSIICAAPCENGFKVGNNGCPSCECNDEDQCQTLDCQDSCQYGYVIGPDGCETCECNENPCDCKEDEECIINFNLEWKCEEKLNGNETCEREDDGDERERSGSKSNSQSSSKSGSDSGSKSESTKSGNSTTGTDRERSKTSSGSSRNRTATLSSLPEQVLLLLSSRDERDEEREENNIIRGASVGASARRLLRNVQTSSDSCRPGFYCKKNNGRYGTCSPVNQNGICYSLSTNPERDCDDNGFYKPRICVENNNGDRECVCVIPENGTALEDTRVILREDSRKPNCQDYVYGSCSVAYKERTYRIKHGKAHFDNCNCRECVCYFGRMYCDQSLTACNTRCNNTRTCTLEDGSVLAHGESVESECNRCACRNGRLICSRYKCTTSDAATNECERCSSERINRVCGPDRRTYPNTCAAVNCFGWDSSDVLRGHCNSHNPCLQFPCEKGEICLRRGGVSCLAQGGCNPSDVRVCVNITRLPCNFTAKLTEEEDSSDDGQLGSGDIDPSDTALCGSDGKSYPAICHVIPQYVSVHVLHAGRCDNRNCRGGEVCGTDGATYENICVLRSLSSNARVDYRGGCIDINGTVNEYCQAVIDQGLCPYTLENCNNLVQPSSGCCPICGSAVVLLLDTEQLRDAAIVISTLGTLDNFVAELLQANFFSEVIGRCKVESTLTNDGNLELVFSSILPEDHEYCITRAQNIVEQINSFTGGSSGRKRQVDDDTDNLPSSYQYIVGAVSAPSADTNASEGASIAVASTIILMIMIVITLVLY